MNLKIFMVAVPVAVVMALFAPQSDTGWRSACGCTPVDVEFVALVGGDESSLTDVDMWEMKKSQVANGFLQLIPPGSDLATIKQQSRISAGVCVFAAERLYSCNYWLQSNGNETRGWSVNFRLSSSKKLVSVEAKKIRRAL